VVRTLLAPVPGLVASIFGVGIGAFLAGKWASAAGVYHGAVVGAGWILLEALELVPTATYPGDAFADTVTIIALDGVTLLVGALAGWLARRDPPSSSGTGRAR
jgi:hypothetical protein